jgi:hypothetical protein
MSIGVAGSLAAAGCAGGRAGLRAEHDHPREPASRGSAAAREPSGATAPTTAATEQNAAIVAYVRWHNARVQPKVNFASNSPIRAWTNYPAKAA